MINRLSIACLFFCFAISTLNASAQTKTGKSRSKKLFSGYWVNKKANRHLSISYDEADYALINDWHGKWSAENNTLDAYKAFIEKDKLVMPEDRTDLRSPYCEIIKQGDNLLFRCRGFESKSKAFAEHYVFVREKK